MLPTWRARLAQCAVVLAVAVLVSCSGGSPDNATPPSDEPAVNAVTGGETLVAGQTYRYVFNIHCGMELLGPFDQTGWKTDANPYAGVGPVPDDLRAIAEDPNEQISPILDGRLRLEQPDRLVFTVPGSDLSVVYAPYEGPLPGCA